ncbi:MAG: hypothetical protein WBM44_05205 [Waterburya sp.]
MKDYAIVIPTILPERQKELGMLLTQIAELCPGVPIVISPHIKDEPAKNDCARALQLGASFGCEWTIYLEDDAFLAPVFAQEVERVLKESIQKEFLLVTFYSDSRRVLNAMKQGKRSCLIPPRWFWSTVCVAVRTEEIPAIIVFAPGWYERHPEHWHASDLLLGAFCSSRKGKILACVPSPVQHKDSSSSLGHKVVRKRFSRTFKAAYRSIPKDA